MINRDILRIMEELRDFTNAELQHALELASSSTAVLLDTYERRGYILRVKVGRFTLNTLTEKGRRIAAKLPAIDEQERLLPLTFEGIVPETMEYCSVCQHALTEHEIDAGDTVCTDCWAAELPF